MKDRLLSPGNVQPDPLERAYLLAEAGAVGVGEVPRLLQLLFMEGADALVRRAQRLRLIGRDGIEGLSDTAY